MKKAQTHDDQWWASVDGDHWLPVDREPVPEDEGDVAAMFAVKKGERDGKHLKTFPMTFALRWVRLHGGKPTTA